MVKNIRKSIAVVAVVAMFAIMAPSAAINAISPEDSISPASTSSFWLIRNEYGPNPYIGYVYDLIPYDGPTGDYGISFRCEHYGSNGYNALHVMCRISNPNLRLVNDSGVLINSSTSQGVDRFVDNWYALNNYSGTVGYTATAYGFTPGVDQYVAGSAW